jgi:hypothetical protein
MKARERNALIVTLMEGYIQKAKDGRFTIEEDFKSDLDGIFRTTVFGFREVVLTSLMARLINPDFKASEDFYACKPRGIFETPIRNTLLKYNIPNKKSGPLNVAKAIKKLDAVWANGRTDTETAMCAVRLINLDWQPFFGQNYLSTSKITSGAQYHHTVEHPIIGGLI